MWFSKKKYMYWFSILLIISICFLPHHVFAQENVDQGLLETWEIVLKLLSWLWVVPATLAGELMTNAFVYGSFIKFDVHLWKMWTFMRIVANYALWFVFLGGILKQFFKPDGKIFDIVKKTIIAGILIQMSWFLMSALVDFSVVLTTAVAAIPQQVMEKQFNNMSYKISSPKKITVIDGGNKMKIDSTKDNIHYIDAKDFEKILPHADTVAWPLVFMGASILKLFEHQYIDTSAGNENSSFAWDLKNLTLGMVIKIAVLIMVAFPLIVLVVVNIVRIFWLWIWIILSPIVILDMVFNGAKWGKLAGMNSAFKLGNMLWLVFQPVVVVGLLSLWLILVISMRDVLAGWDDYTRWVLKKINTEIKDGKSTKIEAGNTSIMINGEFFKDLWSDVWGITWQLIMTFFTIFLLWALVKVGFSTSEVTSKITTGMYDFATKSMKLLPLPIPWLGRASISTLQTWINRVKKGVQSSMNVEQDNASRDIMDKFGLNVDKDKTVTVAEAKALKDIVERNSSWTTTQAEKFWTAAQKLAQDKSQLSYTGEFKGAIDNWLDNWWLKYLKDRNLISKEISSVANLEKDKNKTAKSQVYKYIDGMMRSMMFDNNPGTVANQSQTENISSTNWGKQGE